MANVGRTLSGIVSPIILPKATLLTPPAKPIKNLPIVRAGTVQNMAIAEPEIAIECPIMAAFLLPSLKIKPVMKLPTIRPTIAAELMIVLYKIASSFSHPNLASNTGVVLVLPTKAKPLCQVPRPKHAVRPIQ